MLARALPVLSLALLAACAVDATPSESASSSSDQALEKVAATAAVTVGGLVVTPTDTTIVFAYQAAAGSSYNVVLTGPSGATSKAGQLGVTFTGLAACTTYSYVIQLSGTTVQGGAGQVSTRLSGSNVCPSSETITASASRSFHGVNHQKGGTLCGAGEYPQYPLGTAWTYHEDLSGGTSANIGADQYDDQGSGPFPCTESLDSVYRARFDYSLTALQLRRLTDATFVANYGTESGTNGCAYFDEQLNVGIEAVPTGNYTATSSNGDTWPSALGDPLTPDFLAPAPGAGPLHPATLVNGQFLVDFRQITQPTLEVGLQENNDGLDIVNGVYAQANSSCGATLTNAGLRLTYAELAADTPICTMSVNCYTATFSCSASPDSFTLYRTSVNLVGVATTTNLATGQGSIAGTVAMVDPDYDSTAQYQVCAKTNPGDSAQTCTTYFAAGSNVACGPVTPPSGGGSNGFNPPPTRGVHPD